jgi:hypothetical protein
MNGRHMARDRVAAFARTWRRFKQPQVVIRLNTIDLLIADLEALTRPRVVVRTLAQLQALAPGTVLKVQGDRAAQIDEHVTIDATGEFIEGACLVYAGTDLYDLLTDPSKEDRDTLRRMLPAIVIDPLD